MKRSDFNKVINKLSEKFDVKEDGSDHIDYDIYLRNKLITTVRSSHSPKDFQDQLIARNLHISRTDLGKFVECSFSNKDLIAKIKQKGYWPRGLND
ncbi:MAG: hypothetical protein Q8P80_04425 [Candidatus Levybacteria bacterium]|nr:hypothetical protein [Candidatus Levybacteria bacterium]